MRLEIRAFRHKKERVRLKILWLAGIMRKNEAAAGRLFKNLKVSKN